jgi:hypothetical protein
VNNVQLMRSYTTTIADVRRYRTQVVEAGYGIFDDNDLRDLSHEDTRLRKYLRAKAKLLRLAKELEGRFGINYPILIHELEVYHENTSTNIRRGS